MKNLSNEILRLVANRFKVMADPVRLQILQNLGSGERNVRDIVRHVRTTQPNVSKHLRLMQETGLVVSRRDKNCVYYRVADPSVFLLCETVCGALVDQNRKNKELLETS